PPSCATRRESPGPTRSARERLRERRHPRRDRPRPGRPPRRNARRPAAAGAGPRAGKARAVGVFPDAEGRMNEPLGDREVLCVSQFTLYGDTRKGNRPSYVQAAPAEQAEPLYDRFCDKAGAKKVVFGACMGVALVNDGPVTVILEV